MLLAPEPEFLRCLGERVTSLGVRGVLDQETGLGVLAAAQRAERSRFGHDDRVLEGVAGTSNSGRMLVVDVFSCHE